MSILPLPELPAASSADPTPGLHLSVLDSYAGQPGALQGVSFWPRVAARLLDEIAHLVITFCCGVFFGVLVVIAARVSHHRPPPHPQSSNSIALFLASALGLILFHAFCEGLHGSTPGKLMLGYVVVQEDGSPCRLGPAFIRSFAYVVDAMFFGLIGYFNMQKNPQQQRHGDDWAHTIVVHRSEVAPQNLRAFGIFVMAFLIAAMADAALMISGLLLWRFS